MAEEEKKYKGGKLDNVPNEVLEKYGLKKDESGKIIIQGSKRPVIVRKRQS